jgi:hypothetical protein
LRPTGSGLHDAVVCFALCCEKAFLVHSVKKSRDHDNNPDRNHLQCGGR